MTATHPQNPHARRRTRYGRTPSEKPERTANEDARRGATKAEETGGGSENNHGDPAEVAPEETGNPKGKEVPSEPAQADTESTTLPGPVPSQQQPESQTEPSTPLQTPSQWPSHPPQTQPSPRVYLIGVTCLVIITVALLILTVLLIVRMARTRKRRKSKETENESKPVSPPVTEAVPPQIVEVPSLYFGPPLGKEQAPPSYQSSLTSNSSFVYLPADAKHTQS